MKVETNTVNQDRRGFYHACDKATYRKLKKVRLYSHWLRIQTARHIRWNAKLPHNRVKYVFDGHYAPNALAISFTKWKSVPWTEPALCPISLTQLWKDYDAAKICYENADDVKPIVLSIEAIDAMIESCDRWLESVKS